MTPSAFASFLPGAALLVASSLACAAGPYAFVDLTPADGSPTRGWAINDAGEIAGTTRLADRSAFRAFRWSNGIRTFLDTPDEIDSGGTAINGAGRVVGWTSGFVSSGATVWNGTSATYLASLGGPSVGASAFAINDAGFVAGDSQSSLPGVGWRAVIWSGSTPTDLGTLGGSNSQARGMNNLGQVVGRSQIAGDTAWHQVLWDGASKIDLGSFGGSDAQANDINNLGVVVGAALLPGDPLHHATRWDGNTLSDLGTLGSDSVAFSINDRGQIVGTSQLVFAGLGHAVMWDGGNLIDLNTLLDDATVQAGWVLVDAAAINNRGDITGQARNILTGQEHAYLLASLVAEPRAWVLLLAGLFAVAGARSWAAAHTRR